MLLLLAWRRLAAICRIHEVGRARERKGELLDTPAVLGVNENERTKRAGMSLVGGVRKNVWSWVELGRNLGWICFKEQVRL